jgi:hypothetical protein
MQNDFSVEPNITLHLQGGLGNLLFQIASIKSFCDMNSKTVEFTNFDIISNQAQNLDRSTFFNFRPTIFKNLIHDFNYESKIERKIHAENLFFDNLDFLNDNDYIHLICYLQNYRFFKSKEYVNSLFNISNIHLDSEILKILDENICTSVHVRRTDFLINQNIFVIPSIDYYKKALEEAGDTDNILLFSDDKNWCFDNLIFNEKCLFVEADDLTSLKIMTKCHKHIMANSTFSWWGAYLSESQKVIMPEIWYQPNSNQRPLEDRKLEDWIAI